MQQYIKMESSYADFELQSLICTSIGTMVIINEVDEYVNINAENDTSHNLVFDE